jgi:hypothetical protein
MFRSGSNPLPRANEHFVHVYQTEAELREAVASYALDVLGYDRQGMVFFATRRHCDAFQRSLLLHGLDMGGALARGQVKFVHVEDVLPKIFRNGSIDADAFERLVTGEFSRMRRVGRVRHLHVYGEIVDVLWRRGERAATVRLEELWNALGARQDFTLYCAYLADRMPAEAVDRELGEAIAKHASIMHEVPEGLQPRRVFVDLPRPILPALPVMPIAATRPPHVGAYEGDLHSTPRKH